MNNSNQNPKFNSFLAAECGMALPPATTPAAPPARNSKGTRWGYSAGAFTTLLALFMLPIMAGAQDALTSESIVKMTKAGVGDDLILSVIQSQSAKYSLTPDDIMKLKQEGISEKVLSAMVSKNPPPALNAAVAASSAVGDNDLPTNPDIGVYYKKGGQWEEMLPDVVNWKTGGVLKSLATGGFVKGDINGHIVSAHSHNSATSPLEVLIYAPEGVAITEYQLLRFHQEKDSREFRTVTGGMMHTSGGATRDAVQFESKKIANRTYRITLSNLGPGEYGFLPPVGAASTSAASSGKSYTFRLIE
jgi:hypothetical protein